MLARLSRLPALAALVGAPFLDGTGALLSKEEALALAFEGCAVARSTVALTDEQRTRVEKLCGERLERSLVYPYVATRDGELVGTAWFDAHKVRTLRETLMVVVDPEGRIARIEVLAFGEPAEYLPRASWYAQFVGKGLDETLSLKKGIKPVTGATLTARATTEAARRVLAIHRVWSGLPAPDPEPEREDGDGAR